MKKEHPHHKFDTIADGHKAFGLPEPMHPLISLINGQVINTNRELLSGQHVLNFYKISYKPPTNDRLRYGQHYYDFTGGGLMFAAPNQIVGGSAAEDMAPGTCTGATPYILLI